MRYVQYFIRDIDTQELVEGCGDRSIVILDARNSLETSKSDAVAFNGVRRPVYDGYQLHKGESILRSCPITEIIEL